MAELISPAYIALLCVYSSVLLAVFWGYAKVTGKYISSLGNLPGGFISFLAVNELIALPFMLLHWSFSAFFVIFLLVNGLMLIAGCKDLVNSSLPKFSIRKSISVFGIVAISMILLNALITQFYVKYDADDAYYVSLAQQSTQSSNLYSIDPATENPAIGSPYIYRIEGWELIKGGMAKAFNLSTLELSHSMLPLVLVLIAFLSHRLIFKLFFKTRDKVNLALILLGTIFLFGGYSLYSQGTFLLTRSWQGKATLATVIIPLALFLFLKLYKKPDDNRLYVALMVLSIAAIALNPVSIFISSLAIIIFAAVLTMRTKSLFVGFKTLATASILLIAGLFIAILKHLQEGSVANSASVTTDRSLFWLTSLKTFLGSSFYFYLLPIGIAIMFFSKSKKIKEDTIPLLIFSIVLVAIVFNPLLFGILFKITSTTYWRFYWLIPMTILLPMAGVFITYKISGLVSNKHVAVYPIALVSVFLFVLSGSWVFDSSNPLVNYDVSKKKLPPGVEGVLGYMSTQPRGSVIAATDVSAYYHTDKTPQKLFISRKFYYGEYCDVKHNQNCKDRLTLFQEANTVLLSNRRTEQLLRKQKIDYFIINNRVADKKSLPYRTLYRNQIYTVLRTQQL